MGKQAKIMAMLGLLVLCGSVWAEDSGLIAYWKFDEGSGTTAYDSAGDNDGTIYGAQWTTGWIDGALSFDGAGDYVNCGSGGSLDITDAITIGAWVKRPNFDTGGVITGKTNENLKNTGYGLFSYTGGLQFNFYSGGTWRRTTPLVTISANEWHHVVGTFDGNDAYLYVDGEQEVSLAYSGTIAAATGYSFHISFWRPGIPAYFNGLIDDVRIYDRALSAEEIQQLYQSGLPDVVGLEIIGPEQVRENSSATYKAIVYYDNNNTRDVTNSAQWWVEPNTIASIENGLLRTHRIDTAQYITIYAQYSERGFTVNAEKTVQVSLPVEIEIIGPERVRGNYQTQYKVLAYYDEGPTRDVTDLALWLVEPQAIASIEAGLLRTEEIYQLQDITIYAAYTAGGATVQKQMTVQVLVTPYIWYVPSDYQTIQAAIDYCIDGEEVLVADGTYTGPGNRDIDLLGKAITVRSESGPENCIIDCENSGRGFYFHSGETAYSVLDGFTITNGNDHDGGGIYCGGWDDYDWQGSSPTITNCTIKGNSSGIYCRDSNPTITNCTISENGIGYGPGGGIFCEASSPTITNCTIRGNNAWRRPPGGGGGILCAGWEGACSPTITNCTITGNWGGIASRWGSSPIINNCTITGNSFEGIYCSRDSSLIINNSILWVNTPFQIREDGASINVRYTDVQGGWEGESNMDEDPCFVEPGYLDDNGTPEDIWDDFWVGGDYHLLRTSPCIDAAADANVYTDIEGNVRPFDFPEVDNNDELPEFDMGAYELVPIEAEMKLVPQMLNCNSKGKYVKAHLTLPEEFLPQDVDVNESAWAEPMGAESEYIKVLGSKDGPVRLEIYFDREAFCAQITETGEVEVTVIGSLTTSRYFYGSDTIKIKP